MHKTIAAVAMAVALLGGAACKGKASEPRPSGPTATATDAAVTPGAWADVVALAAPQRAPGPSTELERALTLVTDVDLGPEFAEADRTPSPAAIAALPPTVAEAVAALIRWADAQGRLPATKVCMDPRPIGAMLTLARAAVGLAGDNRDAPAVRALLYYGARLRAEGQTLLEGAIGTTFGNLVLQWAQARGHVATAAAATYDAREAVLVRVIAAEAVCSVTTADMLRDEPADSPELAAFANGAKTPAEATAFLEGELTTLRAYWQTVVLAYRDRAADPAGTDARLQAIADGLAKQQEQHPVLQMLGRPVASVMRSAFEQDAAYRAWAAAR